jgi:hypothetical protein
MTSLSEEMDLELDAKRLRHPVEGAQSWLDASCLQAGDHGLR